MLRLLFGLSHETPRTHRGDEVFENPQRNQTTTPQRRWGFMGSPLWVLKKVLCGDPMKPRPLCGFSKKMHQQFYLVYS